MDKTQKRCYDCKELKDATTENFYSFGQTGYFSKRCIICQKAANKKKQEQYKAKSIERQKAKQKATPSVKIAYFSAKGKIAHDEITEIKKQIRVEAQDMNNRFCKGCSRGDVGLDCSHRLSVKQRPDLAADKDNISLLCRVCHVKHESMDIKLMLELKCFEDDMRYIHNKDEQKFSKILFRLLDHIEKTDDSKAKRMLAKIELFED